MSHAMSNGRRAWYRFVIAHIDYVSVLASKVGLRRRRAAHPPDYLPLAPIIPCVIFRQQIACGDARRPTDDTNPGVKITILSEDETREGWSRKEVDGKAVWLATGTGNDIST